MANERNTPSLTREQIRVRDLITADLESSKAGTSKYLILTGVSGVGKSHLAQSLMPTITEHGGRVFSEDLLLYAFGAKEAQRDKALAHPGPKLVVSIPREIPRIGKEYPEIGNGNQYVLKGMDQDETQDRLNSLLLNTQTETPRQRLAEYSMGLPELIGTFADYPNLTEAAAVQLAAERLRKIFVSVAYGADRKLVDEITAKFLTIRPPERVINAEAAQNLDRYRNIYHSLPELYDAIEEHAQQTGLTEHSPEFVDPATIDLYNEAFGKPQGDATIEVYAPYLKAKEYTELGRSIGFTSEEARWRQDPFTGPRSRIFGGIMMARKANIIAKSPRGNVIDFSQSYSDSEKKVEHAMELAYLNGDLPIEPQSSPTRASMFVHKHEHQGMTDPLSVGHMVESKLQQMGIPYIVYNGYLEQYFHFDPASQKIKPFDFERPKPWMIWS